MLDLNNVLTSLRIETVPKQTSMVYKDRLGMKMRGFSDLAEAAAKTAEQQCSASHRSE